MNRHATKEAGRALWLLILVPIVVLILLIIGSVIVFSQTKVASGQSVTVSGTVSLADSLRLKAQGAAEKICLPSTTAADSTRIWNKAYAAGLLVGLKTPPDSIDLDYLGVKRRYK